jgi:hypothetical protein
VEGTASLLARDARYIALACTQAYRTRLATLSMPLLFSCAAVLVELERELDEGYPALRANLEPVDRRGGQGVGGRCEEAPVRSARRKQSGQLGRGAGLVGVRRVCARQQT